MVFIFLSPSLSVSRCCAIKTVSPCWATPSVCFLYQIIGSGWLTRDLRILVAKLRSIK